MLWKQRWYNEYLFFRKNYFINNLIIYVYKIDYLIHLSHKKNMLKCGNTANIDNYINRFYILTCIVNNNAVYLYIFIYNMQIY